MKARLSRRPRRTGRRNSAHSRPMPLARLSSCCRYTIMVSQRGTPRTIRPPARRYTTQMYTDFIANAAAKNYEFVTLEDLASRIAAQEKAHIDYTTVGNTITTTVTPDASAPDLGAMALDVVNGGTEVIQNVTNWYAYNAQELFLPRNGGYVHHQSRHHAGCGHAHRLTADARRSAVGHRRWSEPQFLHGGRRRRYH